LKSELIDNRIIVWNVDDSKKLFNQGYYGKPIGIPKPKPDEINVPLILDLIEGCYLLETKKITIYKTKKQVTKRKMLEICRNEYHDFDEKYYGTNALEQLMIGTPDEMVAQIRKPIKK